MRSRMSFRLLKTIFDRMKTVEQGGTPVLIYGAGDAGAFLVRELTDNQNHGYLPLGFIDDDFKKAGMRLHGYKVFDARQSLEMVRDFRVSQVLVSTAKV